MKFNILFADSSHPLLPKLLSDAGHRCDLKYPADKTEAIEKISNYDGIVIRSKFIIDKEFIDQAPKLKFIARIGAGMENIDTEYANKMGIKCLHAPEGNKDAVAEHTIGMILCLLNNICKANNQVKKGIWNREMNRGTELMGKTVGVIGYGNMGKAFAERLKGFSVKILVYDKYLSGFGNNEIKEATLSDLFEETDILSLHVPLTHETEFMINKNFIDNFKKAFYLINTARGKIIKTDDIVHGLRSGKVNGACLDVLEYESTSFENISNISLPPSYQYFIDSPNVILTPHIAGWSHESNIKLSQILFDKINSL